VNKVTSISEKLANESSNDSQTKIVERFFLSKPDIKLAEELYATSVVQNSLHIKHLVQRGMRELEFKNCDQSEVTAKELILGILGFVKKQ